MLAQVTLVDSPFRGWILAQLLEPLGLLAFGNMQEELDEQRPALNQTSFEAGDLRKDLLQMSLLGTAVDTIDQQAIVPAAVEDGDPACLGKREPEPI